MCTAVTYQTKDYYFGRNLDYEYDFGEAVTITPRNYVLRFRNLPALDHHLAMIGMAKVVDGYPLYFDATNEQGLSMAALNFPVSARYTEIASGKNNVAAFELIPWLLGDCASVSQVRKKLKNTAVTDQAFSPALPPTPLHWIIADRQQAVTLEQTQEGLQVLDNPVGVLTNEPPFPWHMKNLCNYLHITPEEPANHFSKHLPLQPYSRGMGGIGLPGDLSSASRFIRASFTKINSVSGDTEFNSICQVFHILGSVCQQQGCVRIGKECEKTIYSSCCNCVTGDYYYTTYENSRITGIRLRNADLESERLQVYPLLREPQVLMEN